MCVQNTIPTLACRLVNIRFGYISGAITGPGDSSIHYLVTSLSNHSTESS
jgi:hypothetical protein